MATSSPRYLRSVAALILATSGLANAQVRELPLAQWQHTMWTGAAGPPVPGSYHLTRSSDGYLWLAAENCLLRFDGMRFTVFDGVTTQVLRPGVPGEFSPWWLDRHGAMWIEGPDGTRLTYKDGKFREELRLDVNASGPLGEDERGLLFLSQGRPAYLEQGRLVPVPLPATVPVADIWNVMSDTGGGIWIGTHRQGLWHVSRSGQARQYGTGEIRPLIQSRSGTIWVLGEGVKGTARLEGNRWVPLLLPGTSSPVTSRFAREDPEGAIWFQVNNQGVLRYRNGVVEAFTARQGLSDNRVISLDLDPTGVVWVSTEAGLDRLRPGTFAAFDLSALLPGGTNGDFVPDAAGGLWVAGPGRHSVSLVEGGVFSEGNRPMTARTFEVARDGRVDLLGPSGRGGVWVKPEGGAVFLLRPDGTRQAFGAGKRLAETQVNGLIETGDGAQWIDLFRGLARFHHGRYSEIAIAGIAHPVSHATTLDGRGRLWVAWDNQPSLTVFDGDSVVANVMKPAGPRIEDLTLEHGDTLWAVTRQSLIRIIREKAAAIPLPTLGRLLLPGPEIAVAQGSMWLASAGGIARISLADLHRAADGAPVRVVPQLLDALDGLPSPRTPRFSSPRLFVAAGRVWINTTGGLAVLNATLRTPPPHRLQPRVLIEEATVDGHPLAEGTRLPARPGRLDIQFTVTDLELPERARLQYRLEGTDPDWINASVPRLASYNHLAPGTYRFDVRLLNETGDAGISQASMRFRVPPAWNQAWWFFALVALAIAATAGGSTLAWQRRRSRLAADRLQARFGAMAAERRAQYEATLAERTRIAQDLHDTILQGFAGVTLQLKTAELALPEQPDVAAETILRVQRLARESLREARERVWDMRRAEQGSEDLPAALETITRERTAGAGIDFQVETRGERRRLPRLVEDAALRIGREAIANAVKHAQPRRIEIRVEFGTSNLRLEVGDDGRGFTPDQGEEARRTGHFGLSGIRDRAAQSGGRCDILSRPGGGTMVAVDLPLVEPVSRP